MEFTHVSSGLNKSQQRNNIAQITITETEDFIIFRTELLKNEPNRRACNHPAATLASSNNSLLLCFCHMRKLICRDFNERRICATHSTLKRDLKSVMVQFSLAGVNGKN
jgi:hypothetical protein